MLVRSFVNGWRKRDFWLEIYRQSCFGLTPLQWSFENLKSDKVSRVGQNSLLRQVPKCRHVAHQARIIKQFYWSASLLDGESDSTPHSVSGESFSSQIISRLLY